MSADPDPTDFRVGELVSALLYGGDPPGFAVGRVTSVRRWDLTVGTGARGGLAQTVAVPREWARHLTSVELIALAGEW